MSQDFAVAHQCVFKRSLKCSTKRYSNLKSLFLFWPHTKCVNKQLLQLKYTAVARFRKQRAQNKILKRRKSAVKPITNKQTYTHHWMNMSGWFEWMTVRSIYVHMYNTVYWWSLCSSFIRDTHVIWAFWCIGSS